MRGPIPDKPKDRPTVPIVRAMVERFYRKPGNAVGGVLHCALDDGNIDDGSLRHDIERAIKCGDTDAQQIAEAMLAMTRTQRKRVLSTADLYT